MSPKEIYDRMMEKDAFSHHLGMELIEIQPGKCVLKLHVQDFMLNGHQIAHGGITFAISDSALAFAANAHGQKCVSIETNISHVKSVALNDQITATCSEIHRGNSIALYQVICQNQNGELVALFKGTVKISRSIWE